MFTHKTTQAWDTLATALIDAGFQIKRSWPIRTESEHSLHIARKNAVRSTIFLVARKREEGITRGWWEQEVYPEIEKVAHEKATEFEGRHIEGVDLYISTFGPVLEVFSRYPEVKSMTGKMVQPEEALDVARRVVTNRTFQRLVPGGATGIDEATKFYILAMHFYRARQFPFDEARKLAISVGTDTAVLRDKQHVIRKKSEDVVILDAAEREHSGYIDLERPTDKPLVDAIHLAELGLQRGGMKQYQTLVDRLNLDTNPDFRVALQALTEALPDGDPEKRTLAPLLLQTQELRAGGSRLEDYTTPRH
jgi:adenine-specific DNA methylase